MGYTQVNTNATDIKKHTGQAYEGKFRGSHEITTKIGPQTVWEFMGKDGIGFGIYGFTNLNRAMEALETGAVVRITYTGTQKVETKFGLKDVHQVNVEVWTEEADEPLPF